jgi:Uncharacterized proteins, homologs of microcin C7 resistance protein MccF
MKTLVKPSRLRPGDKIATVSLSWGGAGDDEIRWRYEQGKARIEKLLELEVVELPLTLAGTEYVYNHPKERAADLMQAFSDPSIRGIFSCIGGDETLRLLPYIDFDVIAANPKVFMGYSDTTTNHFMCFKAGLSSIYGPAVLSDFAENLVVPEYTLSSLKRTLFSTEPIGVINPPEVWTSQRLEWLVENKNTARKFLPNGGYELLQGKGIVRGRLIGGCIEVFDWLRGTKLFPSSDDFDGAILFLETSEEKISPSFLRYTLRALAAAGAVDRAAGIVVGKPYDNLFYDEYKTEYRRVLNEVGRSDMPVLYNAGFGHCEPKCCIPYGAQAEIDCDRCSFSILESGVS